MCIRDRVFPSELFDGAEKTDCYVSPEEYKALTEKDGKVYLLMEQPPETQAKDWLSTPSTYSAVDIQLDWVEQRVLETTLFPLGLLKFQFHYLRPAGDHFLSLIHISTVKWTETSSSTPSDCWSPSAPRVRTIPTGTPGRATPA